MNLMWFENFWVVCGVALVLAICSFFVFVLLSMFAFSSSLLSGFNFSFAGSVMWVLEFVFSFSASLVIVWMFIFLVTASSISVFNSPFLGLIIPFFAKGSKADALRPFSNWHFELYGWTIWRNPLGFEFLKRDSNWEIRPPH